jgi:hypothetical protein
MKYLTPSSFLEGIVLDFFMYVQMYVIQHYFICRHSDSTLSEDAGIEPWTVSTLYWQPGAVTTWLDLIKANLCTARGLFLFLLYRLYVVDG